MSLASVGGVQGAVLRLAGDTSFWARTPTGTCAIWYDVSQTQVGPYRYPNGNSATQSGGATNQPAINLLGIGGLPSLTFSGGVKLLTQLFNSVIPAGGDRHVFVVCRANATTGGALISFRVGGQQWHLQMALVGGTVFAASSSVAISFTSPPTLLNTSYVAEFIIGPSLALAIKLNGVAQTLSASNLAVADSGTDGYSIGSRPDGSITYQGDLSDVVVFPRVLFDPEALAVRKTLAAPRLITVV